MTNMLITTPPAPPPPSFGHLEIPISFPLLEALDQFRSRSTRHSLAAIRSLIGIIIQRHCMKTVGEKEVDLNMYLYDFNPSSSRNKVVNWYGVILKLHQALMQTGIYSVIKNYIKVIQERQERSPSVRRGGTTPEPQSQGLSQSFGGEQAFVSNPTFDSFDVNGNLPCWLTFILYWGPPSHPIKHNWRLPLNPEVDQPGELDMSRAKPGIYVELELELLTLNTHGVFDHYFQYLITEAFQKAVFSRRHFLNKRGAGFAASSSVPHSPTPSFVPSTSEPSSAFASPIIFPIGTHDKLEELFDQVSGSCS
jgi:hypothetical protein